MLSFSNRPKTTKSKSLGCSRYRANLRLQRLEDRTVPSIGIELGPIINPANGHTYYRLAQSNWTNAEAEAVNLGGHLATINDAAENAWVTSNLCPPGVRFWIGLNDATQFGVYKWSSGEPVTFTNWGEGQPSHFGSGVENYVEMQSHGEWNDLANLDFYIVPCKGIVEVNSARDILMLSAQLQTGNTVQFSYETTGNPGPFEVGLYRSANETFGPGDVLIGETQTLTPNPTSPQTPGTFVLSSELGIDPSRKHILVVADPFEMITESNEDNNADGYKKWLLGVVVHGGSFINAITGMPSWASVMASSLLGENYDDAYAFDWSTEVSQWQEGRTTVAADRLDDDIVSRAQALPTEPGDMVDLHVIGHSRGAVVASQALDKLRSSGTIPQISN